MASYGSNMIQGAGTGAAAGAAFGPYGAAIGGAIGLAAGFFSAWEQEQDEEKRQEILEEAKKQLGANYSQLQGMIADYYENNKSTGRKDDVTTYQNLVDKYDPNEFVYDAPDFEGTYGKFDVNDYYAPNKDAIIDKVADTIQHRAAGQGIGRGTGAANAIATGVAEKNEDLYKDALAARNSDRQFAYSLWQANIQNAQNRLKQLQEGKNTQLSLYGNMAKDYQDWQNAKFQTQLDLDKQHMNNSLNLTLASI